MSTREERKRARARWPIRRYKLGDEPLTDPAGATTVEEGVELAFRLSRQMWELTGKPTPKYARSNMPGKLRRLK